MDYALNIEKVNKYFDDAEQQKLFNLFKKPKQFHSVKDVSFKVRRGSVFGVLGPNGCGKSTLIRMITTLVLPDSGKIEVYGKNVKTNTQEIKELIGRVSVDASFFMKLNAIENLDYSAGLYGIDKTVARRKAVKILKALGFPQEKQNIPVEKLSRGQQQKISIARGFLAEPKLLLLDEPTTGLDPVSKIDVQRFIKQILKDYDVTIVITSHDMEEIEKLCDKLVIMEEGCLIAKGTPRSLKAKYCDNEQYELVTAHLNKAKEVLLNIEGVKEIQIIKDEKKQRKIQFKTENIDNVAKEILHKLEEKSIAFVSLAKTLPTLEDVFVKLTGKRLEEMKNVQSKM